MPYYAFQCEDGHGTVKMLSFNKSQMVDTHKTGTLRFVADLPWVPREEACETCGKPAIELTSDEAIQAGLLTQGTPAVRINWMAED